MNSFPQTLRSAIEQWINLNSITLHPRSYPSDLLTVALPQFLHCAHLKTLSVDRACYDGEGSTLLSHISGLETLILYGTNRAILQLLPDWLDRLKKTLRIFALRVREKIVVSFWTICLDIYAQNGCGSVTPGVLRSLLPPLVGIRHLELGLSYSLTNDDLFSSLNELPSLQHLELHYYIVCINIRFTVFCSFSCIFAATSDAYNTSLSPSSEVFYGLSPEDRYS